MRRRATPRRAAVRVVRWRWRVVGMRCVRMVRMVGVVGVVGMRLVGMVGMVRVMICVHTHESKAELLRGALCMLIKERAAVCRQWIQGSLTVVKPQGEMKLPWLTRFLAILHFV